MADKKRVYKSEVLALPPLRMVLGEVPSPDPERRKSNKPALKPREMESTVKRIIAHLKDEK
jgi:hypothetical protein